MEITRSEIVKFINELEEKYPVNSWIYQGQCIWPYLKIKLFFSLLNKKKEFKNRNLGKNGEKLIGLLNAIPDFFRIYWGRSKARELYCGASHFKQLDEGLYKTRYFNQLIAASETDQEEYLLLEYESTIPDYEKKVDHPDRTVHFHKITPLLHLWKRVKLRYDPPAITSEYGLELLLEEMLSYSAGRVQISLSEIKEELVYMDILKRLYKRILVNHQVQKVFVLCYYNRIMFPMMSATNELGIPSVDIQHGGQGEEHVAYSNFNVIPKEGYTALPAEFWCWDEGSAGVLHQWIQKQHYHQVKVVGNPWLDHQKNIQKETLNEKRKIILFTLQPEGEEILEEYLIEAIRRTPTDYAWWLRLHPRQMNRRRELFEILKSNKIGDKVVVDEASNYSLPFLLERSYVHISKYSGSILEAYLLNKKSIIISEMGVRMFPEVIESPLGYAVTENDSNTLLDVIYSIDHPEPNIIK